MGSDDFYPEERPVHRVSVDGFWMDEHPVTAAQSRRFVRESGYVTLAERPLDLAAYPDALPELLVPGSLVFVGLPGKTLPTEAEWERAVRGGLEGAAFAWGDEHSPGGTPAANTWQGEFPWQNLKLDAYERTSLVGSLPANGYGLLDVTGNVWEWTSDWFTSSHPDEVSSPCCVPHNPRVTTPAGSLEPGVPGGRFPVR